MSDPIPFEHWFLLRNLVFEVDSNVPRPDIPTTLHGHPAVALLERYKKEKKPEILDEAAKFTAMSKPGVERAFAESHYWTVLDRS